MAKMRISPELKKLIEKYRCVKDTEGMSPAKVYKLVGENENLYLKMTDSRYIKGPPMMWNGKRT